MSNKTKREEVWAIRGLATTAMIAMAAAIIYCTLLETGRFMWYKSEKTEVFDKAQTHGEQPVHFVYFKMGEKLLQAEVSGEVYKKARAGDEIEVHYQKTSSGGLDIIGVQIP